MPFALFAMHFFGPLLIVCNVCLLAIFVVSMQSEDNFGGTKPTILFLFLFVCLFVPPGPWVEKDGRSVSTPF